jgi:hypothetical protein
MSSTPPVHHVDMLQYLSAAATESLHQALTAFRTVVVFRCCAVPQQPSQVQQLANMSVVVALSAMSQQRVCEKAVAPWNMYAKVVTREMFHEDKSRSKFPVYANIESILVTRLVSNDEMSALKAYAW